MTRPFDKNSDQVKCTSIHPHSELKNAQKSYHYINDRNVEELTNHRDCLMYGSDFRSTLPQHPLAEKQTHFHTIYEDSYHNKIKEDPSEKTASDFNRTRNSAGNYNQVPE